MGIIIVGSTPNDNRGNISAFYIISIQESVCALRFMGCTTGMVRTEKCISRNLIPRRKQTILGSLKTRFSICLKVNISRSSSAGVTGKQICRSTIAAGSYILVGYELLNNDFRHVKSLFHFVLPPIKSLRVSPERKALAAWSHSNITIFMLPYKKITIQAIHFIKDYSTERLLVNRFP